MTNFSEIYTVSKNVSILSHHIPKIHKLILIIFGTNVTDKVCNQTVLCLPTLSN